jgi:hypothetical protein
MWMGAVVGLECDPEVELEDAVGSDIRSAMSFQDQANHRRGADDGAVACPYV